MNIHPAKMMKLSLPAYVGIFLIWVATVSAGQVSTNEQFVMDAVLNSTSRLLDSLELETGYFSIGQIDGIDELAANGFRLALLRAGWTNLSGGPDSAGQAYLIDISFSALNFDYKKGKSRGFLRRSFIKREVAGQVLIRINGQGYSYVGFRDIGNSDTLAPDQANYVASLRYNQLSPSVPGAGLKRFWEPLAVTAAAGGLIYLFFANR